MSGMTIASALVVAVLVFVTILNAEMRGRINANRKMLPLVETQNELLRTISDQRDKAIAMLQERAE